MGERILIVDDNETNLKLARVVLVGAGFDVATAIGADEALTEIASTKPRLILMDIQLPGTDGLTLTKQLKADPATKDIVVIAMTAYAMKGDDQKAREAGCDGYIAKPIDTRTLPGIVASRLTKRKLRALILEDDLAFGKLLRIRLGGMGFEVALTDNVEAAQAALKSSRPDVIVSDRRIKPEADALPFCIAVKSDPATSSIIVIMLTGTDPGPAPAGPDLFLQKSPEGLQQLEDRLNALLR